MIKLTLEFKTLEEVGEFIAGKSSPGTPAPVSVDVKPKKEAKKKYTDEDLIEMTDEDAEELLKPAQKGKRTKLLNKQLEESAPAPVKETAAGIMADVEVPPVIENKAPVGIDREKLIQEATSLVDKIKTLGVPEGEIMPKLMQAYTAAGVSQFCRVSELSDTDLPNVVYQISSLVDSLSAPKSGEFI